MRLRQSFTQWKPYYYNRLVSFSASLLYFLLVPPRITSQLSNVHVWLSFNCQRLLQYQNIQDSNYGISNHCFLFIFLFLEMVSQLVAQGSLQGDFCLSLLSSLGLPHPSLIQSFSLQISPEMQCLRYVYLMRAVLSPLITTEKYYVYSLKMNINYSLFLSLPKSLLNNYNVPNTGAGTVVQIQMIKKWL